MRNASRPSIKSLAMSASGSLTGGRSASLDGMWRRTTKNTFSHTSRQTAVLVFRTVFYSQTSTFLPPHITLNMHEGRSIVMRRTHKKSTPIKIISVFIQQFFPQQHTFPISVPTLVCLQGQNFVSALQSTLLMVIKSPTTFNCLNRWKSDKTKAGK